MHTRYFRDCDLEPWTGADFDPALLHRSLAAHEILRDYLLDFRAYLSQSSDARVIGFKDTILFEKLGWLKMFIPPLKVLYLHRDARSIVSSVLRTPLLELWDYARVVPPAFRALRPGYVSRIDPADKATAAAELVAMSIVTRHEFAQRSIQDFDHIVVQLDELMHRPAEQLEAIVEFLGVPAHDAPLTFVKQRQAMSRGGMFSSFRLQDDVRNAWERHLTAAQLQAIEDVMRCA
jgi:hypothetical protein